jgi:tetratricopeptide (TPR) repeat protein
VKQLFFSGLMCAGVISSAMAAVDPLADMKAAVIRQDYAAVNAQAKELLGQKLPHARMVEAEYFLGLSYLHLSNFTKAYEVFRKVLAERPSGELYDKASIGIVESLSLQGQYENALKEVTGLIAKRRDSDMMPLMYLKAARANHKLARWNRAREFLQKIVSEYPHSFESDAAARLLEEKQYFAVQVGSFNDRARAEALMKELLDKKEYAYIVVTRSPEGRTYYRVRAGQLAALKDARDLEKKLAGSGYPTLIYP